MSNEQIVRRVYLGVGSNVNREMNLRAGLQTLSRTVQVVAVSAVYASEAVGDAPQAPYLNAVIAIDTTLDRLTLKDVLRDIEAQQGRQRLTSDGQKSFIVTLDFDILLYDGANAHTDILERDFVAIPLAEIAPWVRHPVTGETMQAIAKRFTKTTQLVRRESLQGFNHN